MLETMPDPTVESSRFDEPAAGLRPLLEDAACSSLADLGWIRVSGEDRVRWLNGMATNSIVAIGPGEGCYNFFLNAQGRIQGDATAFASADEIRLETARRQIPALLAILDHFIIMDDVELAEEPAWTGLLVAGPEAHTSLKDAGLPQPEGDTLHLLEAQWRGSPVRILRAHSPVVPRFEIWASSETIRELSAQLRLPFIGTGALEALRLLEGTPTVGIDIRDRDLPQETVLPGQASRALHFSKGCYLGQEIVERIRSRGNVHRTLSGFTLSGPPITGTTSLFDAASPEKPVGELTSSARVPLPDGPITLALGGIRREVLDRGTEILYRSGEGNGEAGRATAVALPLSFASRSAV